MQKLFGIFTDFNNLARKERRARLLERGLPQFMLLPVIQQSAEILVWTSCDCQKEYETLNQTTILCAGGPAAYACQVS